MPTPIEVLEKWKAGHKRRSVEIQIDDSYGATCWRVVLTGRGVGQIEASEIDLMGEDGDDWPGLGAVILAAVVKANEAGL